MPCSLFQGRNTLVLVHQFCSTAVAVANVTTLHVDDPEGTATTNWVFVLDARILGKITAERADGAHHSPHPQ